MRSIVVAAFYKFVPLEGLEVLREPLLDLFHENEIRGTILLASEGINGTVSGSRDAVDALCDWFQLDGRFDGLIYKESYHTEHPFRRAKVRLKKEIVTMGCDNIDPRTDAGVYVEPNEWNTLISDPDVLLIDARNDYEFSVGSFHRAVNPGTTSFREFPAFLDEHLDPGKHTKVAMFCTGGIRCEKSTSYLRDRGIDHVYHLRGGILQYLTDVPAAESLWEGECFVFDERVTVDHELKRGSYEQCHACRMPLSTSDRAQPAYIPGISCPYCIGRHSVEDRKRFEEREKQIRLASERGEDHLGDAAADALRKNRLS